MSASRQETGERPGPIGRVARILLGLVLLRLFWGFATGFEAVAQPGNVVLYAWAFIGAYSHVLGTLVPRLHESRRRLPILGAILLLAGAADVMLYRTWWAPPLAWTFYLLALVGMGVLGVEFVLAGIVGQIGCEKTVIPNLLNRHDHGQVDSCLLWDPVDRWERQLWRRIRHGR